jgi:long-chain acyl-CoA synthetase
MTPRVLWSDPEARSTDRLERSLLRMGRYLPEETEARWMVGEHPDFDAAYERLAARGAVAWRPRPPDLVDDLTTLWSQGDPHLVWHEDGSHLGRDELHPLVAQARGWLRARGIGPGDRVVLETIARPEAWVAFWAVVTLGAVAVTVQHGWHGGTLRYALERCDAKLLLATTACTIRDATVPVAGYGDHIAPDDFLEAIVEAAPVEAVPRSAMDIGAIRYTSGTTGRPKGVRMRDAALVRAAKDVTDVMSRADDRCFCWGSQHHSSALRNTFLLPVSQPCEVVFGGVPDSPFDVLEGLVRTGATWFLSNPAFFAAVTRLPELAKRSLRGHRLRFLAATSASFSDGLRAATHELFGVPVTDVYGTSESLGFVTRWQTGDPPGVGRPVHAEIELVGEPVGEPWMFSCRMSSGYEGDLELPVDAFGWMRMGDFATQDADGHLVLHGRRDDVFVHRTGENVHLGAVQRVIEEQGGVDEALVVGFVADEMPRIGALVVGAADIDAIAQALRARLPPSHVPERWRRVDVLPLTLAEKPDRRAAVAALMTRS